MAANVPTVILCASADGRAWGVYETVARQLDVEAVRHQQKAV